MPEASLDELVASYVEAAHVHRVATETGDYRRGNKASELLAAIYAELRRRGDAAQRALLPLLKHEDRGVRGWAAAHALDFSPADGEPALEALVPRGGLIAFDAEMALRLWREGRLHFP